MDTITNLSSDIINLILPHLSKVDAANFVLVNKTVRSALSPHTYNQLRIGADNELRELVTSARTALNIHTKIALVDYLSKNRYLILPNDKSMEDIVQTYVANIGEEATANICGRVPNPNAMYNESYILALQGRFAEGFIITGFMIELLDKSGFTQHNEHKDVALTEIYSIINSYVFIIYCSLEYDQTILKNIMKHMQTLPPAYSTYIQTQFRAFGIDKKIEAILNDN